MSGISPTDPVPTDPVPTDPVPTDPVPRGPRGWLRQAAMVGVLAGVVLAAGLTATQGYVSGGLTLSAVCAVAALVRLLLPTTWVGTLAVRRPLLDVLLLVLMSLALAVLTLSVPLPRA